MAHPAPLDVTLLLRMHENYFDGEHVMGMARTLVAALIFLRLDLEGGGHELPRARAAMLGWSKLAPPLSRLPLPWSTTAAIANWVALQGAFDMAVHTFLTFVLYPRPSEALRIRHGDLVAPSRRGAKNLCKWSVILHPQEGGTASKTGQFNESLILDNMEFGWMDAVLRGFHRPAARDFDLFADVTYNEWTKSFRQAGFELGLQSTGIGASRPLPAQARRGVSRDTHQRQGRQGHQAQGQVALRQQPAAVRGGGARRAVGWHSSFPSSLEIFRTTATLAQTLLAESSPKFPFPCKRERSGSSGGIQRLGPLLRKLATPAPTERYPGLRA